MSRLAIKVDVDTDGGTRRGVLPLAEICRQHTVPALFLFSLGPDNMGRSIYRLFQPGFLKKVLRTRVVAHYDLRSLLHGTFLPAPHLGRKHGELMRRVRDMGFEVGIHAYDHYRWQNYLHRWPLEEVRAEFGKAVAEFQRIFGMKPTIAGAAGWQANASSLAVYDECALAYASDTRGHSPFLPVVNGKLFHTPQIPTTLPTLDELLGQDRFTVSDLPEHYLALMGRHASHVLTVHAELEGLDYAGAFESFLVRARKAGVQFCGLSDIAKDSKSGSLPRCSIDQQFVAGRSGYVAVQGPELD